MKQIFLMSIAAGAAILGFQTASDAVVPSRINPATAQAFATGLRGVQADVRSIIQRARAGGRGAHGENDNVAFPLILRADNELTEAADAAIKAAQNASVGHIPQAYNFYVSSCTKSAWAAADLGAAAFAALQPPPGNLTPFSDEITVTMDRLKNLRQNAGC